MILVGFEPSIACLLGQFALHYTTLADDFDHFFGIIFGNFQSLLGKFGPKCCEFNTHKGCSKFAPLDTLSNISKIFFKYQICGPGGIRPQDRLYVSQGRCPLHHTGYGFGQYLLDYFLSFILLLHHHQSRL